MSHIYKSYDYAHNHVIKCVPIVFTNSHILPNIYNTYIYIQACNQKFFRAGDVLRN